MNSIHEAIRKFRPDLKLDGWKAPERAMPAAAAYPEFIKPEMVVRGLAASELAAEPAPKPSSRTKAWRPAISLALVFAVAIVFGAGLALRPAKVGKVEARTDPEQLAPLQNTENLAKPILKDIKIAAPAVAAAKPAADNTIETGTVKLAAIPKHLTAPIRKRSETVSLRPLKSGAAIAAAASTATTVIAAAKASPALQPVVGDSVVLAANPNPNPNVPEILYEAESDSPQMIPANAGELAAVPVEVGKTKTSAPAAPPPASNGNRIQGIFWDSQRPMALLGDNIIEVGSETPLGRVVAIEKNYVVFEKEGGKRVSLAP